LEKAGMPLTIGINHVASITANLDRLIRFYVEVFEAVVLVDLDEGSLRHAMLDLGGGACLHPFQMDGNPTARVQRRCSTEATSTMSR
jgi:catechol 2,3-dioxygenase-like lactoylglutathione lyase family enzyme